MNRTIRALGRVGLLLAALAINGPGARAQCDNTTNYGAYGNITAPAVNASNIIGCNYAGEYGTMTGATIGNMYRVSSTNPTDYITIRATTPSGPVLIHGVTPVIFQATDATIYGHINTNAACGIATSCRDITYTNLGTPCNNASPYGAATAGAVNVTVTIDGCSYAGEYSTVSGITPLGQYTFTSSVATDWITVHINTSNGPVIGFGQTPLTVVVPAGVTTVYPHWNTDQNCGTQNSCRTTTVTYLGIPGACPIPTGLAVSGLTPTSATLNWNTNGSDSYDWEIRTSGAAGSGATGLVASGNALTGPVNSAVLTAATSYSAYVRAVCPGPTTSSWSNAVAFTTPCNAVNVPWSDSFENNTIDYAGTGLQVVPCFSVENLIGGPAQNWRQRVTPIRNGIGARTGTDYMTATWSVDGWLFSPPINLTAGQSYDYSFWYVHTDPGYTSDFLQPAVGTANNGAAMTNLGAQIVVSNNSYQVATRTYVAPTTGVYYFGLRHTESTGAPWYTNTDDWSVIETPTCPSPTAVIASNLTYTSADISWTAPSPAPSVGYEWEVRSGGLPGSGPAGLAASGATAATTASTGSTLTANTTYFAYVRADCGAGSYSPWSFAGQFFTGYCTPTTTNNFVYISNVSTTGGITNLSNASNAFSPSGYGDFTAQSMAQVAGGNVNITVTANGNSVGVNVWVDWNNNLSFDDAGEAVYQSFGYNTITNGTFTIPVTQAIGSYRMRVRADWFTSNPASCGNISYGEAEDYTLQVITPPTCFPPTGLAATNVTTTSADVSWAAAVPAPGVGYDYEVRTSGLPASGPAGLVASGSIAGLSANLVGLASSTVHQLYVRSDCGAGDLSAWAGPYSFTTLTPGQIGIGNTTNTFMPIYSCYGYNYSQQIYLASEYNTPANSMITKIRFYYDNGGTPVSNWLDWTVYMANTTKTDFTSSTDWVPAASLTQVYTGTVTPVAGNWMEITLASPFIWDGTSNILVAVDENTPNYSCTAAWRSYTASGPRGILYYSDSFNPDPNAPPGANYGPTSTLAQIQIVGQAPVPCTAPTPGNTLASVSTICAGQNFQLTLQNQTPGTGVTYQWQISPDNIAPYTDILGATSSSYTATMATTAWYRCNVTCATGPVTVASNPVQVLQSPGINCYCTSGLYTTGTAAGDLISNVAITGTTLSNNTGFVAGTPSYTFYAPNPPSNTLTANLQAGSSYNVNVSTGEWGNQGFAVWIDYNDDGFFATPSERIGATTGQVGSGFTPGQINGSATFPIILACNPPLGTHRMRVRCVYNVNGVNILPCQSYTWGETEDYEVTVTQAVPCPAPFNLTVTGVTTSGATLGWTPGCVETVWDLHIQPIGGGVPSGSGNNPGLTSNTFNATGLTQGLLYEYYVRANCGGTNGESTWVGPKVFGPTPLNDVCANVVPLALSGGASVTNQGHTYGAQNNDGLAGFAAVWEAVTVTTCIQSLTVAMCGTNPVHSLYWGPLYSDCGTTQVYANGTTNTTACTDGNLTIAYGALPPGTYYFPIVYAPGQIEQGPYQITFTAGAVCPAPACASNMVPANGGTACSTGAVLSWGAVPFADNYEVFVDGVSVATVTGTSYNAGVLSAGAHTWSVVPGNSTGDATGCVTNGFTVSHTACYCNSQAAFTADEEIYSVSFNGVPHGGDAADCGVTAPGPGSIAGRYANYHPLGSLWNFTQGIPASFTVNENECDGPTYYAFGTAIWIDLNHDGVFDDVTEKVFVENTTATGPRVVSGTLDIPFTSLPGITGMRITVAESYSGASLTSCLQYGYGETHDYLVNIVAGNNNYTCATAAPLSCFDIQLAYLTGPSSLPATACAFNGAPSVGGTTWWTYTASSNDDVRFKVSTDPSFDVRLSAFKATASPDCSNLVCVGGVDNTFGYGGGGELKVKCNTGDVIYLAVHGVTGISGVITVETDCTAPCAVPATNDLCAGATNMPLAGYVPTTITDDNTCAYVDGPTLMSGTSPVQGLWYTFNSGANSLIRMYLGAPGTATGLRYALFDGGCAGLGAGNEVSNGFAGGYTNLAVTPNTQYQLLVYNGGGNGVEGTYTLSLEAPPIVDASISAILAPTGSICGNQFQPQVNLSNLGETTLTAATISVSIDGGAPVYTYNWTGSLAFLGESTLTLPTVTTPTGAHTLTVSVSVPGDQRTSNDQLTGNYSADGQQITLRLRTDANPGQITWTIFGPAPVFPIYVQGGPYLIPGNLEVSTHCLPNGGRYFFSISDQGGEGINTGNAGSWELRDRFNRMILQDDGTFNSISPNFPAATAGYNNHEIRLPLGPITPWTQTPYEVCRNFNLGIQSKIRCITTPGVSQYQWEFTNPNAGYRRLVTANTNFVYWTSMGSQAPQLGVRYFVRNRADQGAAGFADDNWGEGCEMAWAATSSSWCTSLISTPGTTFSCGATRTWGGTSKLWAQPVVGAVPYDANGNGVFTDPGDQQYAYHFRITRAGGYVKDAWTTSYILPLNWTTLPMNVPGTYQVQVRVQVGGVWRAFCGNTCNVTIVSSGNALTSGSRIEDATAATESLELWPNPVRDGRVTLRMEGITDTDQRITVDVYDAYGKRVVAKQFANSGDLFNTTLDLGNDIAGGLYMVHVNVNGRTYVKHLSVL